jgi:hypothetical protein
MSGSGNRPARRDIPERVKLLVFLRQKGRCALTGARLASIWHSPSSTTTLLLALRPVAPSGEDYDPPQLDPDHIQALHPDAHGEKTRGDQGQIAKAKRLAGAQVEHAEQMAGKEPGKPRRSPSRWPKRPFPKRR